jgi:formate dehydrogenase major subunit
MYIMGENPAMSDPDLNHAREALASLEHLVVQDIFLTETAWLADVVLPASAWPEKTGTFTNTDRTGADGPPGLDPPGDARQTCGSSSRWRSAGPGLAATAPRRPTADAAITAWCTTRCARPCTAHRRHHLGPAAARRRVTYPCLSEDDPGQPVVFTTTSPRPTGARSWCRPTSSPPNERPDADYPMVLITGRQLEHWHTGSMTRRASVLDALEPVLRSGTFVAHPQPAAHWRSQ